jgi:hypothetical protein
MKCASRWFHYADHVNTISKTLKNFIFILFSFAAALKSMTAVGIFKKLIRKGCIHGPG